MILHHAYYADPPTNRTGLCYTATQDEVALGTVGTTRSELIEGRLPQYLDARAAIRLHLGLLLWPGLRSIPRTFSIFED